MLRKKAKLRVNLGGKCSELRSIMRIFKNLHKHVLNSTKLCEFSESGGRNFATTNMNNASYMEDIVPNRANQAFAKKCCKRLFR